MLQSEGLPTELMNAVSVLIIKLLVSCCRVLACNFVLQGRASGGLQVKFIIHLAITIIWSSFSFFLSETDSVV